MGNDGYSSFGTIAFRRFFLKEFTKELIRSSGATQIYKLQRILENAPQAKLPPEQIKEKVREIIKAKEMEVSILSREKENRNLGFISERQKVPVLQKKNYSFEPFEKVKLIVPEVQLPERFRYLKPVPNERKIALAKLDVLIDDPFVRIIECDGAGENIVVKGNMGEKKTNIILNKNEVEDIIKRFENETRIPAGEGIYKVVFGRLIFLAIVSEVVGSKFIIRKMPPPQNKGIQRRM